MKNIIKNTNKKGFTIVELVIVIAVIAILAGVLIPTFSSIITEANESAALQEATNAYKEAYADALLKNNGIIKNNDTGVVYKADGRTPAWTFTFTSDGNCSEVSEPEGFGYEITVVSGVVTLGAEKTNNNNNNQ